MGWCGSLYFSHQFLLAPVDWHLGGVHCRPSLLLTDFDRDLVGPQLWDHQPRLTEQIPVGPRVEIDSHALEVGGANLFVNNVDVMWM